MTAPVLETPRLILREYRMADFPAHDACWADPRTTRFFNDFTYDREMVWLRFQRNWGQWALFGHGWWALEMKEGGAYAGSVGFFEARRDLDLAYRDMPEAGWFIAPDLHGQGLVTEALTAALSWADRHIDSPESWCMIGAQNVISQKTAAKLGYRRGSDTVYRGHGVFTFRRPRAGIA